MMGQKRTGKGTATCRFFRRTISGLLFVLAFVGPAINDLANLLPLSAQMMEYALPEFRLGVPHEVFHILTPVMGLAIAAIILAGGVVLEPFMKGEKWAWWVLVLAGIVMFVVKIWGTATIYAHGPHGGLTIELELPIVGWLAAKAPPHSM